MLFLILSIVIFNSIAFFMPKRLSKLEIFSSSLFSMFLQYMADYTLDLIHGLYGYFKPGADMLTFVVIFGIYPAINTIFLNYFPLKGKAFNKLTYMLGWSLFSLFYEWLSMKSKYFYHNGWTLGLSLISYPICWGIIVFNFLLIRKLSRRGSWI
jgi:hypothetical protein